MVEQGNLAVLRIAADMANTVVAKVAIQLPLTDGQLGDANLRQLLVMHTTLVQEYYDALCRALTGGWQAPVVQAGHAGPPPVQAPAPPPVASGGTLPPLPSQILGSALSGAVQAVTGAAK